jgi:hypothetical protein
MMELPEILEAIEVVKRVEGLRVAALGFAVVQITTRGRTAAVTAGTPENALPW